MSEQKNISESERIIKYLTDISGLSEILGEDRIPLLQSFLKDMSKNINPSSVLYKYVYGYKALKIKNASNFIFPFEHNLSQRKALENAFSYDISMIEGPPGTGKTQTILNIIVNAIMEGKSIAVVSQNNFAIENIYDKLKEKDLHYIAAKLGNRENKEKFILEQPDLPKWISRDISNAESFYSKIRKDLAEYDKVLDNLLCIKNKISELKNERDNLVKEKEYYDAYISTRKSLKVKYHKILNSESYIEAFSKLNLYEDNKWIIRKFKLFCLYIKCGIYNPLFYFRKNTNIRNELAKKYYELKISELEALIENLQERLNVGNFDFIIGEYTGFSEILFKANLIKRYQNMPKKEISLDTPRTYPEYFLQRYPVVLSTTFSLRYCLSKNFLYDYVIIDEASQVDVATGALALSCAKRAIIVGDEKQLVNIVSSDEQEFDKQYFKRYNISDAYKYSQNNIISSFRKVFKNIPVTLLKEHYRCNPKIINFCNKKFYNNELIPLKSDFMYETPMVVYKTSVGNHGRNNENQREIDVIKDEIIPNEVSDYAIEGKLGIVTPYRNQANSLIKAFKNTGVNANTVDGFQGRECENVILSTVDNNITVFTDTPNRVNVAVSRAKEKLIVVTNGNPHQKDGNIKDLVSYIEYNFSPEAIRNSAVYSVFDLLYKANYRKRMEILNNKKRISDYDSENLIYILIKDILKQYPSFDVVCHKYLHMIFKNTENLSKREKRYIYNNSHVDFLIYNQFGNIPLLAIEVDGVNYHRSGSKQAERDKIKDGIFKRFNIELLRLSTNGSNERQLIVDNLNKFI